MVDPSKSGKDKVRSNTFHHFKKLQSEKNPERSNISVSKNGGVPIVFHKFAQDYAGTVVQKDMVENLSMNRTLKEKMEHQEQVLTTNNSHQKISQVNNDVVMGDNNNLVIKLDPRYNANLKTNKIRRHFLRRRHPEIESNNMVKVIDGRINGSISNKNKIKKVSFVNNVGKHTEKTRESVLTATGISTVSEGEIPLNESFSARIPHKKNNSNVMAVHQNGELNVASSKGRNQIKSKISLNEFECFDTYRNKQPNLTGKFISDSKVKLNKSQPKPPVINGYSTYTFKVNLKDQK
ncbi:similar to Kazachstania africana KAFR_0H03690 hypothetical protein [Maudiozyma saulgeensis]|uniref:Uncharacterized protein n=1 Tax=Maudiozyma saulgeensis TaxID=1789683 RepID=A0A1X7QXQ9_9SACH|nr:similar to Kazachstania africana KAFR_0H03690 hypothetical protein [Kazachstania saulgeensis]